MLRLSIRRFFRRNDSFRHLLKVYTDQGGYTASCATCADWYAWSENPIELVAEVQQHLLLTIPAQQKSFWD